MATLSGNKIKDTYQSLVKFSDNGNITTSAKQLTDGFGNNSPMFVSTTQVGIGVTPESGLNLHVFGDAKIGSNLTVIGNLVVEGSTTTVGTDTLTVKDPLIVLANNNTSTDAVDIGFYGKYTPSGTTLYSGLFREALTGKYRLFKGLEVEPTTTVNTSGTGYAVASLVANLEGNVTGGTISGTTGDFSGNVDIDGTLDVDDVISVEGSAFGRIEIGGASGGYVDLKAPNSDDYDLRLITSVGGAELLSIDTLKFYTGATTDLAFTIDASQNATFENNVTIPETPTADTHAASKGYVDAAVEGQDTLAEILAIGNTTGGTDIAVSAGDDITFTDTSKSIYGTDGELEIHHNGTNSYITEDGTGALYLQGTYMYLTKSDGSQNYIELDLDGATDSRVKLNYGGATKLTTTSTGVSITGVISGLTDPSAAQDAATKNYVDTQVGANNELSEVLANGNTSGANDIIMADNQKINFGDDSDLQIYSDGTTGFIKGVLDDIRLTNSDDDTIIKVNSNTAELYHNNVKKLSTTTSNGTGVLIENGISINDSNGDLRGVIRGKTEGLLLRGSQFGSFAEQGFLLKNNEYLFEGNWGGGVAGDVLFMDAFTPLVRIGDSTNFGNGNLTDLTVYGDVDLKNDLAVDGNSTFAGSVTIDSSTATLNLTGSNTGASLINFADAADGNVGRIYYDHTDNFMQFKTNDSEKLRIDSSGNVLINSGVYLSWGTNGASSIEGSTVSNKLQFRTNSTDAMIIDSSQNVGIGTTNPSQKLHVSTGKVLVDVTSSVGTELILQNLAVDQFAADKNYHEINFITSSTSSETTGGYVRIKAGQEVSGNDNRSYLGFWTAPDDGTVTEKMRIDSSGNVGIGTTSPSSKLHIKQSVDTIDGGLTWESVDGTQEWSIDANNAGNFRIYKGTTAIARFDSSGNFGIGTTSPDYHLEIENASSPTIAVTDTTNNVITKMFSANSQGFVGTESNHDLRIRTNNTDKLTILSGGNVGIGTTSPSNGKLVIQESGTSIGSTIRLIGTNTTGSASQVSHITSYQPSGGSSQSAALDFKVRSASDPFATPSTVMTLLGSGNVGIGDDTPTSKLTVLGTSTAASNTPSNAIFDIQGTSTAHLLMGVANVSPFGAWINTDATGQPLVLMGTGGNVGIGEDSPSGTLDIRPNSNCNYVFDGTSTSGYTTTFNIDDTGLDIGHNSASRSLNLQTNSLDRLTILGGGNVGIGDTTPSYKLDVNGTIRATGDVIAYSDKRVKENIKTIDNSLEKVNQLRGVEFNKIGEDKKSIGVIAQEIEKILPEVVREDDKGMKSVAYGNITGILIEAIKELKSEVEELKKQIK